MNGGKRPSGYTIIEVMIVLAVSGVMFFIAASFISGKQARTAFTIGTNEFTSLMQETISQVQSGQFSDVNFSCVSSGVGSITIVGSARSAASNQGKNAPCVYVGKAIALGYTDASGALTVGTDTSRYAVISLASARNDSPSSSLLDFSATPIATKLGVSTIDITSYKVVPQSLNATNLTVFDASGAAAPNASMIVIAQSQGLSTGSGSVTSQPVVLYYTNSSPVKPDNMYTFKPASSAYLCLSDGTRHAKLSFGSNADRSSTLDATLTVVSTCP